MMDLRNYFMEKREKILPWVTDWTDSQDKIRYTKDVKKLEYYDWFYCHPSAYKMFNYGINIIGIFFYSIGAIYSFIYGLWLLTGIMGVILLLFTVNLIKKIRMRKSQKDLTFYDLWMRDYYVQEGKNEFE